MINRVREFREARSLTQAGLADRLGISRQSVNAIETGKYDPSLPIAFGLARVFETTIESLFDPGR
jgi:putative transcriptional regulator